MLDQALRVHLGERSYDIVVTNHALERVGAFARQRARGKKAVIIADERAYAHEEPVNDSLLEAGFNVTALLQKSGETQKALENVAKFYDALVDGDADRHTLIVAIGGGVTGDLAGFVAATFARGIPLLMVPTTLLAMVDSSVGGKVGVNHPRAKNIIGAFHQPIGVFIDTSTLSTLPDREFRSGLAEVVKYGVILDADFFTYLEQAADAILQRDSTAIQRIVLRSCELKAKIVEQDEREVTGVRVVLNYGHTFAHAFETAGGYTHWLHGEAVAAGMVCASLLAQRRGLIGQEVTDRQVRLLQKFGLPIKPEAWPIEDLVKTMRKDKKAIDGRMRFILPKQMGHVALFDDVPESDVREVLQEWRTEYKVHST